MPLVLFPLNSPRPPFPTRQGSVWVLMTGDIFGVDQFVLRKTYDTRTYAVCKLNLYTLPVNVVASDL
jgi:hypothetical protein